MEFGKEKIMYYIAKLTDKIQFLEDFICKRKILSANWKILSANWKILSANGIRLVFLVLSANLLTIRHLIIFICEFHLQTY